MDESYVRRIDFETYTEEEKKRLCVVRITNHGTTDALGVASPSGLSDPLLGSSDPTEICTTCSLNGFDCPGHLGYIKFVLPLYNPMFFSNLLIILKGSCFICHKTYIEDRLLNKFTIQMKLIRSGLLNESIELDRLYQKWEGCFLNRKSTESSKDESIIKKTNKYFKTCLANNPSITDSNQTTRTETQAKLELFKTFIKETYTKVSYTKCSHCKFPRAIIKHELYASISIKLRSCKESYFENIDPSLYKLSSIKLDAVSVKKLQHLTASDVYQHCLKLYHNYPSFFCSLLGRDSHENLVEMFFLESICVIPPKFRPITILGDNTKFENPTTGTYRSIIIKEQIIENLLKDLNNDSDSKPIQIEGLRKRDIGKLFGNKTKFESLQSVWTELQSCVNTLYDKNLSKSQKETSQGLRQILEKKEGLFRMHMMGKRVNYAARSVISPDPMLDIDEVGVPHVFATKLTYQENITPFNTQTLIDMVKNGPNVHPGATHVEIGRNKIILNSTNPQKNLNASKRIMAEQDSENIDIKVRRHLLTGDIVLMNRQPTLHRPSIMGHRVRTLRKDRTIRMHYANCKSYNADFDGDEMNCHFPQNEASRAEAYNITGCSSQYLSPKDGKPLIGLIQDYMVAGVIMSMRDRFLPLKQYQNIVQAALVKTDRVITCLPPAILKPEELWTGKQVISTIIINCTPVGCDLLNMNSKSKLNEKLWPNFQPLNDHNLCEDYVIIRSGQLLNGIFDKNQFGASPYGLIHVFNEVYGGTHATRLLSVLGRACISMLQYTGFSVGVEDLLCHQHANHERRTILFESRNDVKVESELASVFDDRTDVRAAYRSAHISQREDILSHLDNQAKNIANEFQNKVNSVCSADSLIKPFPKNSLHMMILSGSKGTSVNAMQISGLLGQMELEGRRPPLMISGRSLPCFREYSSSLRSGGFVESSFLVGLNPSEYFFHCMAGREGLVDTAVKTSRSGYLQRCLVKHMEGIKVAYDFSARDSDGSIIQFLYGEDGGDVCSLQFVEDKKLEIFGMNSRHVFNSLNPELAYRHINKKAAVSHIKKVHQKIKEIANQETSSRVAKQFKNKQDFPTISNYNPGHFLGAVSEKYFDAVQNYIIREEGNTVVSGKYQQHPWQVNADDFRNLMFLKYIRSLAQPGDSVGVLSAQSVGEPSTQMTLNTFHFAGRGESNVTLGIPRLRELFLVAGNNIKTPTIDINVLPTKKAWEAARKLCSLLNPTPVSKLIKLVNLSIKFEDMGKRRMIRQLCQIEIVLLSPEELKSYELTQSQVAVFLRTVLIRKLASEFTKKKNISSQQIKVTIESLETEKNSNPDDSGGEGPNSDTENKQEKENVNEDNGESTEFNKSFFREKEGICFFELPVDVSIHRIALMPIVKNVINTVYINQTKNIKRCVFVDKGDVKRIHVEGDNIEDFTEFSDTLAINTLYCNNITRMAQIYGIEAARMTLMKEIKNVFEAYGITINQRHLSLLTDYMTYHGVYKPCNRFGINSNPSPLQKMSFETTIQFLKNSCMLGEGDSLLSPSSRIVTGLPISLGTGSFDLVLY